MDLAATTYPGRLLCIDIQEMAIESTKWRLAEYNPLALVSNVQMFQGNFKHFPPEILEDSVKLIVYNLGYLPGGDKTLTTKTEDTIPSIEKSLKFLVVGGLLSVMCYPGHEEGARETKAVKEYLEKLDSEVWRVFVHAPLNRPLSPQLLTVYRVK